MTSESVMINPSTEIELGSGWSELTRVWMTLCPEEMLREV